MSIKLTFTMGALNADVSLKESALAELVAFITKHQDGIAAALPPAPDKPAGGAKAQSVTTIDGSIGATMAWLKKHTASEVLTLLGWKTYPEKILLLAAFHESNGGKEGWRNADMEDIFKQAKEAPPKNFPRDIRLAIGYSWVGTVTSRTYRVGRAGWEAIAKSIAALEAK